MLLDDKILTKEIVKKLCYDLSKSLLGELFECPNAKKILDSAEFPNRICDSGTLPTPGF